MYLTAHSGCCGTPLNSKEYLLRAVSEPVDFLEVDVRRDERGALFLSHSPSGDSPHPLTLGEAFRLLDGWKGKINCDCKTAGLGEDILKTASESGMPEEKIWFSGTNRPVREADGRLGFSVPAARIFINAEELVPGFYAQTKETEGQDSEAFRELTGRVVREFFRTRCAALNIDWRFCTPWVMRYFREEGVPLSLWTVDEPDVARKLADAADPRLLVNMTSNVPREIAGALF